jgi:hypothetical protein
VTNRGGSSETLNWRKAFILVEGQTEERFVNTVLLLEMPEGLYLQPVIVATKRVNSGGKFKGGVPTYDKVRGEVVRLLTDSSAMMVTTMLDYYGLPSTFPGPDLRRHGIPSKRWRG